VLFTVIAVRLVWHMSFNTVIRWRDKRSGFHPPRPMLRPSVGSGLVISWAGMRGIVSLAAALALPEEFPYRNLILLAAFSVVVGTLVIQGLTLKPLLRWLNLQDDDPVSHEVAAARERALSAALASLDGNPSPLAEFARKELKLRLADADGAHARASSEQSKLLGTALGAARKAVIAMRTNDEIGDDAFHQIEERLDWLDMATERAGRQ